MANNLKQNLDKYLNARKISDENIQLDRERLTVIKKSKTSNEAQKKASPTPVAFFVYNIESPYGVKASIDFKVTTKDIYGGECNIIGYEIYKDGMDADTENRENRPILIASIDPSQIIDEFFSFTDPSENELASYYTVVAIDGIGNRSQVLWQKYHPEIQPINDLSIVSYTVNSNRSIDFNLSIVHTMNDYEYDDELLDFYDILDSIQLKLGSDWISGTPAGNFKDLSINYQPQTANGTLNFRALSHKNTLSDNVLQLSYGDAGYDIEYTVGTLNQAESSVEEDLYTNRDGTVQSRIKINLDSDDAPPKVLVKLRKSGEANFKNVLEIDYDTELYVEGGAYNLEAGIQYYLEVYPKTEWGLLGDKIEFDIELVGKDEAPTPVYFTDETGTEITSKIFEKGFGLTWEYAIDADDDTYELRYGSTTDTWETATFLWKGRADRYYLEDPDIYSGTTVRIFIKSRNRSGKEQTTAKYIDCDNNTPSKPNIPGVSVKQNFIEVDLEELNTSGNLDILHYLLYVTINGTENPTPVKMFGSVYNYPVHEVVNFSCRVVAVDVFRQESDSSNQSGTVTQYLSYKSNAVEIYPSNNNVTDTENYEIALQYIIDNYAGDGIIIFKYGNFTINNLSDLSNYGTSSLKIRGDSDSSVTFVPTSSMIFHCDKISGINFSISGVGIDYDGQPISVIENCNVSCIFLGVVNIRDSVIDGGTILVSSTADNVRLVGVVDLDCDSFVNSSYEYFSSTDPSLGIVAKTVSNSKINVRSANGIFEFLNIENSELKVDFVTLGYTNAYDNDRQPSDTSAILNSKVICENGCSLYGNLKIFDSEIKASMIAHSPIYIYRGDPPPGRAPYSFYGGYMECIDSRLSCAGSWMGISLGGLVALYDGLDEYRYSYGAKIKNSTIIPESGTVTVYGTLTSENNDIRGVVENFYTPSGEYLI